MGGERPLRWNQKRSAPNPFLTLGWEDQALQRSISVRSHCARWLRLAVMIHWPRLRQSQRQSYTLAEKDKCEAQRRNGMPVALTLTLVGRGSRANPKDKTGRKTCTYGLGEGGFHLVNKQKNDQ